MRRDDWPGYRRATLRLAVASILVALAIGFGIDLIADRIGMATRDVPIEYITAALVSPILLVVLAFWFAARQDAIDRTYGTAEED